MGRNNQHAGMHMKWYRGDRSQGDFSGYDRYIDMIAESKLRKMTNHKAKDLTVKESKIEQKLKEASMVEDGKATKNRDVGKNTKSTIEKTQVIPDKYFVATFDLYANIFTIAFEKGVDVFDYVCECEKLFSEDKYINRTQHPFELNNMEKTHIYLHMLADKMGCEIYEFFIMNEDMRQKRIYNVLKNIMKKYKDKNNFAVSFDAENDHDTEGNEYTVTCLSLSDYYFRNPDLDIKNDTHYYTKNYIHRTVNNTTGEVVYSLNVLTRVNYKYPLKYMCERIEIYAEIYGEMANFFEESLRLYLESGEQIGSCVTW